MAMQYVAEISCIDSNGLVPDITIASTDLKQFQLEVNQVKDELLKNSEAVVICDNDGQCYVPHTYYSVTNKYVYGQQ